MAGLTGEREPSTAEVLEGQYSPEQCRALFPKTVTQAQRARISNLRQHLDKPPEPKSKEYQVWRDTSDMLTQEATTGPDHVGRRVDLRITNEQQEHRQEDLVDTSITHPSNKTNITKSTTYAQLCLRKLLGRLDKKEHVPPNSPALEKRAKEKIETYSTLMTITEKQYIEGRRLSKPVFVPAIATTHGELGLDLIRFMERITAAYKFKMKQAPPRADGRGAKELTTTFRRHLREKVLMAVIKGTARVLRSAGLGKLACRKYG
jgi:hypothetical protein